MTCSAGPARKLQHIAAVMDWPEIVLDFGLRDSDNSDQQVAALQRALCGVRGTGTLTHTRGSGRHEVFAWNDGGCGGPGVCLRC